MSGKKGLDIISGVGPSTSKAKGTNNQPLRFHSIHSNNIQISPDKSNARLIEGFNCGAAFSDRPVHVHEKVTLRVVDIKYQRIGGLTPDLSIGFTSINPATLRSVPDILSTMSNGYWITWLRCQYYENVQFFHFYVNRKGKLHYGVDGEDQGEIISHVNIRRPLWAVIQLTGGLREVEFTGPETSDGGSQLDQGQVKDKVRRDDHRQVRDGVRSPDLSQIKDIVSRFQQSQVKDGVRRRNQHQVNDKVGRPDHSQIKNDLIVNGIKALSVKAKPTSRYQNGLVPLKLHETKGKSIIAVHSDGGLVARLKGISHKSYIFSAEPILPEQTIVIQIFATDRTERSLTIGFTSCDPATLTSQELPDDAELLQDRPEYWVVYPDAANGLEIGDELGVKLTQDGKVEISKNASKPDKVIHVDITVNLWAFIDLGGRNHVVKVLISKKKTRPKTKKDNNSSQLNLAADMPSTSGPNLECTICLEDRIDCVIYKCGHMCLCYKCALKQWKGDGSTSGRCPLCRGIITDVIRTYVA